jgi:hypothetical protein
VAENERKTSPKFGSFDPPQESQGGRRRTRTEDVREEKTNPKFGSFDPPQESQGGRKQRKDGPKVWAV